MRRYGGYALLLDAIVEAVGSAQVTAGRPDASKGPIVVDSIATGQAVAPAHTGRAAVGAPARNA